MTFRTDQQKTGFAAIIFLEDENYTGYGSSKKAAKDDAANKALMNTAYGEDKIQKTPVTEINELCQKDSKVNMHYSGLDRVENSSLIFNLAMC